MQKSPAALLYTNPNTSSVKDKGKSLYEELADRKWPILFLIAITVFYKKGLEIFDAILTKPLFSTIDSTLGTNLVFIGVIIFVIYYYGRAAVRGIRLSPTQLNWSASVIIVYTYVRLFDFGRYKLKMYAYCPLKQFALADTVYVFALGGILYHTIRYFESLRKRSEQSSFLGFSIEQAVILTNENDIYGRWSYVGELVGHLCNTKNEETSFAVGIIGAWGAGKTTFMKGIQEEIGKREDRVIDYEFNPWLVNRPRNITAAFFKDLSNKLAEYDKELKSEIVEYAERLIKNYDNDIWKPIKLAIGPEGAEADLAKMHKNINRSIKKLKKKIFIRIDDLDRLQHNEIIEILRIVRNTANFGNTVFLIAYDKNIVIDSIYKKLGKGRVNYLDKIIQLEYYLPITSVTDTIDKLYFEEIVSILTERDQAIFRIMYAIVDKKVVVKNGPTPSTFLKNNRDLMKLVNLIKLSYHKLSGNIYLPDYLYVSMLRMKYPELYQDIYYNQYEYLDTGSGIDIFFIPISGILKLKYTEKGSSHIEKTQIYGHVNKYPERFSIDPREWSNISIILESLFKEDSSNPASLSFGPKVKIPHSNLAIRNVECFDRYFDHSFNGRIKEEEFANALKLPLHELKKQINIWSGDRVLRNDLEIKLEHFEEFESVEHYEKIMEGIIYLSDLPRTSENGSYGFLKQNLYNKLGLMEDGKFTLPASYDNDTKRYQDFVLRLLKQTKMVVGMSFFQTALYEYVMNNQATKFVERGILNKILIENYEEQLKAASGMTDDLFQHMNQVVRLDQDNTLPTGSTLKPLGLSAEAADKTAEFMIEKDFEKFLRKYGVSVDRLNHSGFKINGWMDVFFPDKTVLEGVLNERKESSEVIKEYLNFYEESKKQDQKPIEFDFKHLVLEI